MAWRRLRAGEIDHELVWLGVTIASFVSFVTWLRLGLPGMPCPFHVLTGWPCPSCGLTRCLQYLLRGSIVGAWAMNPLAFLALIGVVLYNLYAAVVLLTRSRRLRFEKIGMRTATSWRVAAIAAILTNWVWLVISGV